MLLYAVGDGEGHNKHERRNEVVSVVNMLPGVDIADQMDVYWKRAREGHTTQVLHVIQSFSKSEFSPENPEDLEKANIVGYEFATRYYPKRQVAIFTQVDGKGGYVHNHIVINDVEMETYKGCEREQYHGAHVMRWTDEVAKEFTDLETGKASERTTKTEQVKREKGDYVWKDDLRERIKQSLRESSDSNEFSDRLRANGVDFVLKTSKKYGVYYTYELKDFSNRPEGEKVERNYKARSYKLGGIYSYEGIEEYFEKMRSVEHEEYLERKQVGKKYKPKMSFRQYLRANKYEYKTDELGNISQISADYQQVVQEYEDYLMAEFEEIGDESFEEDTRDTVEETVEDTVEETSDTVPESLEETSEISDTVPKETQRNSDDDIDIFLPDIDKYFGDDTEGSAEEPSEEVSKGFIEEPEEVIKEPEEVIEETKVVHKPKPHGGKINLDGVVSSLVAQRKREEQMHGGQQVQKQRKQENHYYTHHKSKTYDGVEEYDESEGLIPVGPTIEGRGFAQKLIEKEEREKAKKLQAEQNKNARRQAVFAKDGAKASSAIMKGLDDKLGGSSSSSGGSEAKAITKRIYGTKKKSSGSGRSSRSGSSKGRGTSRSRGDREYGG